MPETLGSLVDRLITVDMKMWNAQELLYEIRRLSFEEFLLKYQNYEGMKNLYNALQKACNLNMQRTTLIDDIDNTLLTILQSDTPEVYCQKKCKTY